MKKLIILAMCLLFVPYVNAKPQKSKKFILSKPQIEFLDSTKIPLLSSEAKNLFIKKLEKEESHPFSRSLPLYGQKNIPDDYAPKELIDKAESKRKELKEIINSIKYYNKEIIYQPNSYSKADIKYYANIKADIIENPKSENKPMSGITCQIIDGDTLVLNETNNSNSKGKWKVINKFEQPIIYRDYLENIGLIKQLQTKINNTISYWTEIINFNQKLDQVYNEALTLNEKELESYKKRVAEIEEERLEKERIEREEQEKEKILGTYNFEFTEPTSEIKTKSITNFYGAHIKYKYYINENGYEVYHGKFEAIMNFKNDYYNINGKYMNLSGTETLTCYYHNGILHGNLNYNRNLKSKTKPNSPILKKTYNFKIYKGFLTGNFNFNYEWITYNGNAKNGILDFCEYETSDGFHGSLTSNSSSTTVSIPEINNGIINLELYYIYLKGISISIPSFRFPLLGK